MYVLDQLRIWSGLIVPPGPLCNEIVAIPPGQDPNIRMEQHISTQCSVMTGKSGRSKSTPVCAKGKCGKVLFVPIRCDVCLAWRTFLDIFSKCSILWTEMQSTILSTTSLSQRSCLCSFDCTFQPKACLGIKRIR
jgi:hypothetical protein